MMTPSFPQIYLVRHGQTAWSASGQHTGRTDIPLTEQGEAEAAAIRRRLSGLPFTKVYTSPSQRARRTAELAGFGAAAEVDQDLAEWDYGKYEGIRTVEIHQQQPDWHLFRDGAPGGESVEAISARADRIIAKLCGAAGDQLVFSSGHFLRVLAARWLGLDASAGRLLVLHTASLSILGYEHNLDEPVLISWNVRLQGSD
jgi:broad specificity phosphatase PhoE